jgi:hypothetical protein
MGTWVGVDPQLRRIPVQAVLMVVIWLAIAGFSRLPMRRWSLPVVTAILTPCCYLAAYLTHIFLFALLMATFAIATLLLVAGAGIGRVATRGGSKRDGDAAMSIFAGYVIGQFIPLFY